VNPWALAALVLLVPLAAGSIYQTATAGFSPFHVVGLIALLGIAGAVKRIRDDRRDMYDE
jgi:uncharacterized membrane protein